MKNFRIHLNNLMLMTAISLLIACGSDNNEAVTESITLNFKAEVDGQPLQFSSDRYTTAAGNEISVDKLKIYISAIQLVNSSDNSSYSEVDSYHLLSLDADNDTYSLTVTDIPDGLEFDQVKFAIGVDTDKNFSLDNTGDLDPANDMAWNWDTGYKFYLMEGNYYPTGEDARGLIVHIGHDKNYREFQIGFNSAVNINSAATIDVTLDPLASLNGPNQIDLTDNSTYKGSEASDVIADNYAAGLIKAITSDLQ